MRYIVAGRLQKTLHIWFEEEANPIDNPKVDIIRRHGISKKIDVAKVQYTLLTNLSKEESAIFSEFASNTRNEIRRAEREGVTVEFFDSAKVDKNPQILTDFAEMYREMYREKNIKTSVALPELRAIIEQNGLLVARAIYQNKVIVYHVYIFEKNKSRLLYSCSNFRITDKETQKVIGWANRLLHWKDMLYLKERGVTSYDWGGVSTDMNGIDKFKLSFGGEQIAYYNTARYVSKKAQILRKLLKK